MRRGLWVVVAVVALAASGCVFVDGDRAAETAVRACEVIRPDTVLPSTVEVPTEEELVGWETRSAEAADLAAEAAVLDADWTDLANAYSAYADANATMAALWRRMAAVDVTVDYPDAATELAVRKSLAGVTDVETARAAYDLDTSGKAVRSGCRRAQASAGR